MVIIEFRATILFAAVNILEPIAIKLILLVLRPIGLILDYHHAMRMISFEHNVHSSLFRSHNPFITILDII